MMKCLQESRMRKIRTSGSTRGGNGAGEAARCSLLYCGMSGAFCRGFPVNLNPD